MEKERIAAAQVEYLKQARDAAQKCPRTAARIFGIPAEHLTTLSQMDDEQIEALARSREATPLLPRPWT